MKSKRRLISLLLAIAVLAGIAIMAVSADGAVKITNIGSTGTLSGIPSVVPAENVTYLSDIYNTAAQKYHYVVPGSNGQVRDFALDQNFFGTRVYPFTAASDSSRFAVTKGASNLDADGYRTLNNGVKVHYTDIALGRDTTIFDKGLSFQPSAKGAADQATVIFDVSGLDADYFYAVAGMTGEGNKSSYQRKLDFELYGSKDTAYSESMTFEKLAYAEGICAWLMGEFNIPIEGYNYIKLVAVTKVSNSSAESAWADACVYSLPTTTSQISIAWDDTYNPTAVRPQGDLTAQLFADGVAVEGKTAALNAANSWTASWSGLDKYQDDLSTQIVYTAALTEDPALHHLISNENGVITYQYDATLTTKDIPVSLTWDDASAPDQSARPSEVVVQLYADSEAVTGKTVTLNSGNQWQATFAKLAEKKRLSETETADIVYTFKVLTRSNNYTAKITEDAGSVTVTMTYASSNAKEFSTIGKSGTLEGIPADATGANTHYLTDMLNGRNKRVSAQYIAGGGSYKAFENYEGQVQVIYGGGAKQQLVTEADTQVNGVTYQPTDIVLGANGTVYAEGLSFMVSAPAADDTYITYDLSGMNATNFYGVAGITGTANDLLSKDCYLTFEVWGSKDGTTFEKLGYAEQVRSYLLAEFNVDITGYNYLKLTAYNTGVSSEGASAVWADALVYTSIPTSTPDDPTDPTDPTEPSEPEELPGKYTESTDGSYAGIKAAKDSVIYLSAKSESDASKGKYITGCYVAPKGGQTESRYPSLDYPFTKSAGDPIVIGEKDAQFSHGLGVLPVAGSSGKYTYIILDISNLSDVDRFYAVAALTGTGADKDGNNYGSVFEVYGSPNVTTNENDASFKKLAVSGDVFGKDSGEFDVDITGMKTLKLVTLIAESNKSKYNTNCQSIWANACVYKYDANGTNPVAPVEPEEDDGELPGVYTSSSDGSYKWISDAKNSAVTYLSKLVYKSSSNSSAGNPTTKNEPYGEAGKKIIIGQKNTGYTYGLGVHPKSGSAEAYTIYDLSGLDVDRFYSAVGITNAKGKTGSSEGVIFKVYVDYQGNGSYKQLAESEIIKNKQSGEFHVDITGAKSLKLVVNSTTGNHASSASAWAAACVYKYDPNGGRPTSYTTVGATNEAAKEADNSGLKHTDGFIPSSDGEYAGVDKKHYSSIVYLSDLQYLDASNTTNSANPNGQPTTLDHPYNDKTSLIIIGENERAFFKGLGVHPKNPKAPVNDSIQSWTTYDVSDLDADRFYAAVGLTNDKGKEGASKGVVFRVYADYDGNGNYKLLAHSGCLDGRDSGEFDLDITGVKTLKLTVEAATSVYASSASAWANACVYDSSSVTEGVGKPVIKEPTVKPDAADPTEPVEETLPTDSASGETSPLFTAGIAAICVLALLVILLVILLILKSRRSRK